MHKCKRLDYFLCKKVVFGIIWYHLVSKKPLRLAFSPQLDYKHNICYICINPPKGSPPASLAISADTRHTKRKIYFSLYI